MIVLGARGVHYKGNGLLVATADNVSLETRVVRSSREPVELPFISGFVHRGRNLGSKFGAVISTTLLSTLTNSTRRPLHVSGMGRSCSAAERADCRPLPSRELQCSGFERHVRSLGFRNAFTRKAIRKVGFLTIGLFDAADPGPGHESVLEVIELGEKLGFDSAWLRHRHLQYGISSPMAVLAAATQRTPRIELGTAVTPLGWENPLRLAETLRQ